VILIPQTRYENMKKPPVYSMWRIFIWRGKFYL